MNTRINEELIIRLRNLSHVMHFLYEGKGSQKRVLIILREMGGNTTQKELTRRLGIQPGSASEVIAKLEQTGCIRRSPSREDKRTADISLTEKGRAQAEEARNQRMRRHEEMFACLSGEEKKQLLSLLTKINEDWDSRYQGDRKG